MKRYLKAFFYSGNNPQPVYFFIFILMGLICCAVALRIFWNRIDIDTGLILGMLAGVPALSSIVMISKKIKEKNNNNREE